MGGLAGRRRAEISVRAVGRHAQARRPGPRAGARSRAAVPRRADRRASIRSAPPAFDELIAVAAEAARPDRVPDHPRSRHALRDLRPGGGAGRQEGDRGRNDSGTAWLWTILGSKNISTGRAGARRQPSYEGAGRGLMETRSNYVLVGAVTLALLAGLLLFIVWLAGLSNKADQMLRHLFRAGRRRPQQGLDRQLLRRSGRPDRARSRCFPTGPNSSGCGSRSMTRRRCSRARPRRSRASASPASAKSSSTARSRAPGRSRQVGPQGCPVIPASSGGLGALLNSAPELIDRIQRLTERLTELLSDKNQNAISDILENVDTHDQGAGRARARPGRRDRRCADRGAQCRHRRPAGRRARRQHQPAGQRAGQAGRRGSAQGDRLGPARGRQSRRDDRRCAARASRISPSRRCPRPTAWCATCANCRQSLQRRSPSGSNKAGSAARSGREKLPDYKPRKRQMKLRCCVLLPRRAGGLRSAAARSAACWAAAEGPADPADADAAKRRCPASIVARRQRRPGGDDRRAGRRQGTAHGPRPGAGRPDRRSQYVQDLQWVDTPDRLFQELRRGNGAPDDQPRRARPARRRRSIRA